MGKGERSSAETKAHNISLRQKENRGGTKGEVGEDTGGEEVRTFEMAISTQRRLPRWLEIILDS